MFTRVVVTDVSPGVSGPELSSTGTLCGLCDLASDATRETATRTDDRARRAADAATPHTRRVARWRWGGGGGGAPAPASALRALVDGPVATLSRLRVIASRGRVPGRPPPGPGPGPSPSRPRREEVACSRRSGWVLD